MNYDFFDYKYNIAGYEGQDYYGIMHTVYMLICFLLIPVLVEYLRHKDKKTVSTIIRVTAVALFIEEIAKISWESYWDITTGNGFNFGGILPLETCSIFIYSLIAASFGKGKVRDWALCWMSTIGVVGGISYVLFTNVLKWYPFFTYGAFHSMIFHFMMVFVGLLITCSGYYRFELSDVVKAFMPQLLMAVVVVPLDYLFDWDYMLLHYAGGVPLVEEAAEIFASRHIPYMTTLLMLTIYFFMGCLFTVGNIHIQKYLAVFQQWQQKRRRIKEREELLY